MRNVWSVRVISIHWVVIGLPAEVITAALLWWQLSNAKTMHTSQSITGRSKLPWKVVQHSTEDGLSKVRSPSVVCAPHSQSTFNKVNIYILFVVFQRGNCKLIQYSIFAKHSVYLERTIYNPDHFPTAMDPTPLHFYSLLTWDLLMN